MADLSFDELIIIRWDNDEGRVVYDLGDLDPWAASAVIRQVLADVEDYLPSPRDINTPPTEEDDD